jgi:hypothetical protein
VKRSLVNQNQFIDEKQYCRSFGGKMEVFTLAKIHVSTPYYTGQVKACVIDNPVCDLILGNIVSEKDVKELRDEVGTLKGEITFLREKIKLLEENKLLQNQCHNVQVRNRLLEYQAETHNRCEILSEDLQSVKEDLKEAYHLNKSLRDNV